MALKLIFSTRVQNLADNQQLSFWEKCYAENKKSQCLNNLTKAKIQRQAKFDVIAFKKFAEPVKFWVEIENNPEYMQKMGYQTTPKMSKQLVEELSVTHTLRHFKEYETLLNLLDENQFEDTFKSLILQSFLEDTLTFNFQQGHCSAEMHKRCLSTSLRGILCWDKTSLNFLYENAKDYQSFKDLCVDAFVASKKEVLKQQQQFAKVNGTGFPTDHFEFENLNTNGLGQWIKFSSKSFDAQNYENAERNLSALMQGTNSCLAYNTGYLNDGAVYVFVDNNFVPRIRAICDEKDIQEFRGLAGGQNVEAEFIDVAKEFLTKNLTFYSKIFLDYQNNNQEMISITQKIKNGTASSTDLKDVAEKLTFSESFWFEGKNEFAINLENALSENKRTF